MKQHYFLYICVVLTSLASSQQMDGLRSLAVGYLGDENAFVALGHDSLFSSPDGKNWSIVARPDKAQTFSSILNVETRFFLVGGGSDVFVTTDGVSYDDWPISKDPSLLIQGIDFDCGGLNAPDASDRYVAVGRNISAGVLMAYCSLDNGERWSNGIELPGSESFYLVKIVRLGGVVWVAYGGAIWTSKDSEHWSVVQSCTSTGDDYEDVNGATSAAAHECDMGLNRIIYAKGTWVAVGAAGVYISTDNEAQHWKNCTTNTPQWRFSDLTYTGVDFTAVGANGIIARSPDGCAWTQAAVVTQGEQLTAVASDGFVVVVVSLHGAVYTFDV